MKESKLDGQLSISSIRFTLSIFLLFCHNFLQQLFNARDAKKAENKLRCARIFSLDDC